MYHTWTKGLTKEQEQDLLVSSRASQLLLKRIKEVLQEEENKIEQAQLSRDAYDKSSWSFFQADCLGQRRSIKRISGLIDNLIIGNRDV